VADGKTANVIYIGDYDPAGVLIDQSLEAELRRHIAGENGDDLLEQLVSEVLAEYIGPDLYFHRLAITEEQIAEFDLPTKPRKETDRRALHVKETVEAEAMPASALRDLLRDEIESFLPAGALEVAKAAEASQREHLRRWADLLENGAAP